MSIVSTRRKRVVRPVRSETELKRVNILGVGLSAINYDVALKVVEEWIKSGHGAYVTVTGVHGVMEAQKDEELRGIFNRAGMVTPDGMPMVWVSRYYGEKSVSRVYGPNLMLKVCERSQETGWRHFFYGGKEGVNEILTQRLREKFPDIQVAGTYCPPFRPLTQEEEDEVINQIIESKADIVWVGLSTPKQERFMAKVTERLPKQVLFGVGAAFDFHAGLVKQAPSWIQSSGLEWAFRLYQEPKRLWRRYLTHNPAFIWRIGLQFLGKKPKQLEPESLEEVSQG